MLYDCIVPLMPKTTYFRHSHPRKENKKERILSSLHMNGNPIMLVDSRFVFLFAPVPVVLVVLALAAVVQSLHDIRSCNRLVLHKYHPEVLRAPIFLRTGCRNLQFLDLVLRILCRRFCCSFWTVAH